MSLEQIHRIEDQLRSALRVGNEAEIERLWETLLELSPTHTPALMAVGQRAVRRGNFSRARALFERLTAADPKNPEHWGNLALICRELGDDAAEEVAIKESLTRDPMDLLGLILRAERFERKGDRHGAAMAYGAVATVAPPIDQVAPHLRAAIEKAVQFRERYDREFAGFLDSELAEMRRQFGAGALSRFADSLDIMVGRKRRYESRSAAFHYSGLPVIEFFDRSLFPWMDAFESATDAIRGEFESVFRSELGFEPYIQYSADQPVNQWAELNQNPRWSAFHLLKDGAPVSANADRCPQTMALLSTAPQPEQAGKTPVAMFSLLKPQTRIPPHCGVSNVRLVTHVPLIVPPACGFRVGNTTREWKLGQGWAFDDTIEHEAWNNSDQLRVVLIFDVWHPMLSAEERAMITALNAATAKFKGSAGGFEL